MGDLDGSGRADVVMTFTGYGDWVFYNNTNWSLLHGMDTSTFTIGDVDDDTNGGPM